MNILLLNHHKGGTLLYIDKSLKYKLRKDLNLNKPNEIELTFIEIIETKKKNTVISCIYKHPKVPIKEFLNDNLQPLLIELSFEKEEVILMGDFNINLLNCNTEKYTSDYIDTLYSHSFYPSINSRTRINPTSKILIDDIFYNNASNNIISGNCNLNLRPLHSISTSPRTAHRRSTAEGKRKKIIS